MTIAALYDIHGNLPALEAVLEELEQMGVDQIVVGGDVVLGPMSKECLDKLLEWPLPVHFIQGNCEVSVLAQMEGQAEAFLPEQVQEAIRWTARELNPAHKEVMSQWPKTINLDVEGIGKVLFCHATPHSETEIFTRLTPEAKLLPIFEGLQVDLVICGHTHMQFDRKVGKVRVINAGSVGMPFGAPGADWLLLGPDIQLKHTRYDFTNAANRIRKTTYPQAANFANNNVLKPPTEAEMLDKFKGI